MCLESYVDVNIMPPEHLNLERAYVYVRVWRDLSVIIHEEEVCPFFIIEGKNFVWRVQTN